MSTMEKETINPKQHVEYWTAQIQMKLLKLIQTYLDSNNMTRTELAQKLGVTKGYVSQVMAGDYDHRISKMVELTMAIGYIPDINFKPAEENFSKSECFNPETVKVLKSDPSTKTAKFAKTVKAETETTITFNTSTTNIILAS